MSEAKEKERMQYAVELECQETDTRHFRHIWTTTNGGALASVPPILQGEKATIALGFNLAAKKYATNRCMGTRTIDECEFDGKKQYWKKGPYEWRTYQDIHGDVQKAAKGLATMLNRTPADKDRMCVAAILAETSADWQVSAQAAFQCGITITTVYTTLGHEAMMHGINETEAAVIFVDWGQYDALKTKVIANCPSIKHVVLIGKAMTPLKATGGEVKAFPRPEEAADLGTADRAVTTLDGLIEKGNESPVKLEELAPRPEDTAFIMYTSGSTGLPKGVVLTHANFIAVIAGLLAMDVITPGPSDVYIAYLPLAHILELMIEVTSLCQGAMIGYGHPRSLTSSSVCVHPKAKDGNDLMVLRPTLMAAVPAILDVIKTGLQTKLSTMTGLKGKMVRTAVAQALNQPSSEGGCAKCLVSCGLKNVLLKKVKAQLGLDKVKAIASGGAPLSPETQEYVSAVLAPVAQGYGATETVGCTTVQEVISGGGRPADRSSGTVGSIMPCAEIKLKSVPDMGYLVTDQPPRGEILIGGHTCAAKGYFKMEAKTAEDFPTHEDGKVWFHTGDIGVMTGIGTLKIIDRKKDLIKLSGGEYVSLGKVEAALKQVPGIGACVVFARSDKSHCVCIVSQPEKGWNSVGGKPEEEKLTAAIFDILKKSLSRFEIPTKVKIDDLIWLPEDGLVTASLKVQRNPLREHYNKPGGLLDQMDYRFPES